MAERITSQLGAVALPLGFVVLLVCGLRAADERDPTDTTTEQLAEEERESE